MFSSLTACMVVELYGLKTFFDGRSKAENGRTK